MQAQAAGEHAIGHHVLEDVAATRTGGVDTSRDQVCPVVDIFLRVINYSWYAGSAAGCVQAYDLLKRYGQHRFWVTFAEIVFSCIWYLFEIVKGFDTVG